MIARTEIVAAAREWIGTPYRHQGRTLGVACDCAGLIIEVGRRFGFVDFDTRSYGRMPNPRRMGALLDEHMERIPIREALPGDVYWLAWREIPQHLGFLTDVGLLHAHNGVPRVVEHPLDAVWRGRVRAAFRFRGLC